MLISGVRSGCPRSLPLASCGTPSKIHWGPSPGHRRHDIREPGWGPLGPKRGRDGRGPRSPANGGGVRASRARGLERDFRRAGSSKLPPDCDCRDLPPPADARAEDHAGSPRPPETAPTDHRKLQEMRRRRARGPEGGTRANRFFFWGRDLRVPHFGDGEGDQPFLQRLPGPRRPGGQTAAPKRTSRRGRSSSSTPKADRPHSTRQPPGWSGLCLGTHRRSPTPAASGWAS